MTEEVQWCNDCKKLVTGCRRVHLGSHYVELGPNDSPRICTDWEKLERDRSNGTGTWWWMCNACWEKHIAHQVSCLRERRAAEAAQQIRERLEEEEARKRAEAQHRTFKLIFGGVCFVCFACVFLMVKDCANGCGPNPTRVLPDGWRKGLDSSRPVSPDNHYSYWCSPNGTPNDVYGDGPYSTNSSVCSAAVHAGVIQGSSGGRVEIVAPSTRSCSSAGTRPANGIYPYGRVSSDWCFDVVAASAR